MGSTDYSRSGKIIRFEYISKHSEFSHQKSVYPLPTTNEVLSTIADVKLLTKLNVNDETSDETSELLKINAHKELFKVRSLAHLAFPWLHADLRVWKRKYTSALNADVCFRFHKFCKADTIAAIRSIITYFD